MFRLIIFVATLHAVASFKTCVSRRSALSGEDDGHYCVCNATYCDDTPTISRPLSSSTYSIVTSSKSGLRFKVTNGVYRRPRPSSNEKSMGRIIVDSSERHQKIIGFGGAVTDSAGLNINSLSKEASDNLMRSYFGRDGLEYSIIRTPMGGTDFSERGYTYVMKENDTRLESFELQPEDYKYKIPIIRKAMELSDYDIKLLTAPWTATPWMKTKHSWKNDGKLRREYYQLWANYFTKYFQAYSEEGFKFWALTPQNEPMIYQYQDINVNGMAWTAEEQRDFVIDYLAPTLQSSGFSDLKILVGDDNRQSLPNWPKTIMSDKRGRQIVAGTAVHWYYDDSISPSVIDQIKELFPEKLILYTEACTGVSQEHNVILGSWERGERYARNIIENMSHWASSWIDWNIALNLQGGPTWISNFVDSPVIVNATANEFYKQPMFYALGHFSKYVPPQSVRIGTKSEGLTNIKYIGFKTPNRATVLVMLNMNDEEQEIVVQDRRKGMTTVKLAAKSINTMKYW